MRCVKVAGGVFAIADKKVIGGIALNRFTVNVSLPFFCSCIRYLSLLRIEIVAHRMGSKVLVILGKNREFSHVAQTVFDSLGKKSMGFPVNFNPPRLQVHIFVCISAPRYRKTLFWVTSNRIVSLAEYLTCERSASESLSFLRVSRIGMVSSRVNSPASVYIV